ncbi:hypothetical protein [Bacillus sp. FJAT-45350]|uniref:hypothetical protein n=1 Tax=Bacillus sp. FJAT-45350 TaxID=2011014 RepID=UPI000BB9107E|nr:hypothetical protein [Bacillus sp. FJAT-45350]
MTKKRKVLRVDELIIHANDVKIIQDVKPESPIEKPVEYREIPEKTDAPAKPEPRPIFDPWGFGPPRPLADQTTSEVPEVNPTDEPTEPLTGEETIDDTPEPSVEGDEQQETPRSNWSWI